MFMKNGSCISFRKLNFHDYACIVSRMILSVWKSYMSLPSSQKHLPKEGMLVLKENNKYVSNNKEIYKVFNSFIANVFSNLKISTIKNHDPEEEINFLLPRIKDFFSTQAYCAYQRTRKVEVLKVTTELLQKPVRIYWHS